MSVFDDARSRISRVLIETLVPGGEWRGAARAKCQGRTLHDQRVGERGLHLAAHIGDRRIEHQRNADHGGLPGRGGNDADLDVGVNQTARHQQSGNQRYTGKPQHTTAPSSGKMGISRIIATAHAQ